MPKKKLKVVDVQVLRPTPADMAAGGVQALMGLVVEVENQSNSPLYVWASQRGYDYDSSSKVLTVHLAEKPLVLPPGLKMISDHPQAPAQVEVAPKGRVKIRVQFPAQVRRPASQGAGGGWFEDHIGDIEHVNVSVQFATNRVEEPKEHETSAEFRTRLLAHGDVVRASIAPSSGD